MRAERGHRKETSPRGQGPRAAGVGDHRRSHKNTDSSAVAGTPGEGPANARLPPTPTRQNPSGSHCHRLCPASPSAPPQWGHLQAQHFFFFKLRDGIKRNRSRGQYPQSGRGRAGLGTQPWNTGHRGRPDSCLQDQLPDSARGSQHFYQRNLGAPASRGPGHSPAGTLALSSPAGPPTHTPSWAGAQGDPRRPPRIRSWPCKGSQQRGHVTIPTEAWGPEPACRGVRRPERQRPKSTSGRWSGGGGLTDTGA